MDELRMGKVSTQELAEWFCTTKSNLSKNKTRFLKKLQGYCEFTPIYGGIEITKIMKYTYVKNPNYQIVLDNIERFWDASGLDTCAHVGGQIYEEYSNILTVKESTTKRHSAQARNEKWGNPKEEESQCHYMLCKKDTRGKPIFLSDEEKLIKEELLKKWFGTADEKTAIVQSMVNDGEITSEEAWETYSRMMKLPKSYAGFMKEFKDKTGIQLIRGTYVRQGEEGLEELTPEEWEQRASEISTSRNIEKFDF